MISGSTRMERQNCFWIYLSLNDTMETYPKFPTVLKNDPDTRLLLRCVFLHKLWKRSSTISIRKQTAKVETFFQIKSFPSQKCQTQLLNVIMVLQPSRVREAFDPNILMLSPWKKDLRSKQGALGNCEMTGFVLQHLLEPAFCLQAAKSHCSTWWSQVSQKAAAEGSAHLVCHQPLFFFQNNEKHTWSQIWSNWPAFLFGSSLILNKHKI